MLYDYTLIDVATAKVLASPLIMDQVPADSG